MNANWFMRRENSQPANGPIYGLEALGDFKTENGSEEEMMKSTNSLAAVFFAAAFAFAISISGESIAAEKHGHDAQHGGQLIELDGHQAVEMVTRGTEIIFYISENDKPADLHGGAFRLFVQNGSDVMSSTLAIEGNRLTAKLAKAVPSGAKIVVTGKDGHGHVLQARFVKK